MPPGVHCHTLHPGHGGQRSSPGAATRLPCDRHMTLPGVHCHTFLPGHGHQCSSPRATLIFLTVQHVMHSTMGGQWCLMIIAVKCVSMGNPPCPKVKSN